MDEEDEGFVEEITKLIKEATYEAFVKAREMCGEEGIILARDRKLIRLFPDDSFEVIRELK